MSAAVFPSLPGLTWDVGMSPQFSTRVQQSVSGREVRAALMAYPLWKFSLAYELLRADLAYSELQTLTGFFLQRQGMFDSFLYLNPVDHQVTAQPFGTGNGSTTRFVLARSFGGFAEPVQNSTGITVYVNGVSTSAYVIDSTGAVVFNTAPPSGAALTWSGQFYYRCRFLDDVADFNNFMYQLWELKKLEFIGSPMNKV
jgi:uncharacterized protein (TIGR02217 family)